MPEKEQEERGGFEKDIIAFIEDDRVTLTAKIVGVATFAIVSTASSGMLFNGLNGLPSQENTLFKLNQQNQKLDNN